VLAAAFVAEIGDVTRVRAPGWRAGRAGLTPRHRESDTAVQRIGKQHRLGQLRERVADRRGRNIGKVAAAPS
jgi:hypothetical protein